MIQVFKLICSGENKVENVQKIAVPTGGPGCRRRAQLSAPSLLEVTVCVYTYAVTWTLHPHPGGQQKEKH